jgi:hypothetical protein
MDLNTVVMDLSPGIILWLMLMMAVMMIRLFSNLMPKLDTMNQKAQQK